MSKPYGISSGTERLLAFGPYVYHMMNICCYAPAFPAASFRIRSENLSKSVSSVCRSFRISSQPRTFRRRRGASDGVRGCSERSNPSRRRPASSRSSGNGDRRGTSVALAAVANWGTGADAGAALSGSSNRFDCIARRRLLAIGSGRTAMWTIGRLCAYMVGNLIDV